MQTSLTRWGSPPKILSSSDPGRFPCSKKPLELTARFVVVSLSVVSFLPLSAHPCCLVPPSRASSVVRFGAVPLGLFAGGCCRPSGKSPETRFGSSGFPLGRLFSSSDGCPECSFLVSHVFCAFFLVCVVLFLRQRRLLRFCALR